MWILGLEELSGHLRVLRGTGCLMEVQLIMLPFPKICFSRRFNRCSKSLFSQSPVVESVQNST